MITVSELMIGNYVEYDPIYVDEGTEINPVEVIVINAEDCVIKLNDGFENLYGEIELNPIILSPEVIVAATEFKEHHSNEYWRHFTLNNGWCISQWVHEKQIAGFEENGVFYHGENYIHIKYFHQLQNLYFAFNQKKLEINFKHNQ